jgi:glycosyltransferase involved in cell wall biosynthesis
LVAHLSQSGISIKVFTSQPGYAYSKARAACREIAGKLQIRRSRCSRLWSKRIRGKALNGLSFVVRAALHLLRHCRQRDLIVLTTAPPFLPLLGYFSYVLFKIPYVCILYDLYPDIAVGVGAVSEQHFIVRFWQKLNLKIWRNSAGLIVLSDAMKQRILSYCPEVADRISVIHSWTDPGFILPIPKAENWFAWRHDLVKPFTVTYSGNMGRCHDMTTLLQTAVLLRDQPIQFVFIGAGAKRPALMEQVKQLDLPNCKFLPYQDKHDLPYTLTACDLSLVSVDQGMESLVAPSKLYPALAAGRPIAIVCPQSSYLKQMVEAAECGAAFANHDAQGLADFIECLHRDPRKTQAMGHAARNYAIEHFTLDIVAQQYLDVFQRAVMRVK